MRRLNCKMGGGHAKNALPTLLLALLFLLNGCATRRDGPPPFNVDVSRIPDAVPKVEPLSKVGNKPYHVKGKTYYVMHSSKNYVARGTASWYGTAFHGHKASDGERYDMLSMTAAHKTLPLPSYVRVTNLKNGEQVVVKVTDRGPFSGNRLIDLSYVAAKKLGMLGRGTAPVEVRAITPSSTPLFPTFIAKKEPVKTLSALADKKTYVQVAAFRNRLSAEKLEKRLAHLRVDAPVSIAHSSTLYHVQIGPIQNKVTLAKIHRQLRAIGIMVA